MAALQDKVQNALDESRLLLIGVQILVGFQLHAAFQAGFDELPDSSRKLALCVLASSLLVLALLVWPAAYHRIVTRGECTEDLHEFASTVMDWALLPFALGLAIAVYVTIRHALGQALGVVAGTAMLLTALGFWYGFGWVQRARKVPLRSEAEREAGMERRSEERGVPEQGRGPTRTGLTDLTTRIRHVLTEARMVSPGVQALFGFQLTTILSGPFERLPEDLKLLHLASLGSVALTLVLLMTPAAYHRIVERGEENEDFHRVASRLVVAALVPLTLGLSGDFYVVAWKVTRSPGVSLALALTVLALLLGMWFGYPLVRRRRGAAAR